MPVSTRQATPGPSHATAAILQPQTHPRNLRKRSGSEVHEDHRDSKKIKVDVGHLSSVNGKDKRKRRKKKKKTSVVILGHDQTERARSKSRSVPLSSNKRRSIPSRDFVSSGTTTLDEEDDPALSPPEKGKGKAKSESPSQRLSPLPSHPAPPIASSSGPLNMITPDSTTQASEIARLKEQLATQGKLLERHQTHLSQHQQSLTCQICLDLMHKPYALAPCGHITCYGCLVRWFTAPNNPEIPDMANDDNAGPAAESADSIETILNSASARSGSFIRRRKNCPVCRAVVTDRPIEIWGIKSMVSAFLRSGLGDLPVPAPPPASAVEEGANADPWRNVFRKAGSARQWFEGAMAAIFPPPQPPHEQPDDNRELRGWYDAEDGGIYRCVECYHEIWGGVCTSCNRGYPGHDGPDSDDDDEDDHHMDHNDHNFLGRHLLMTEFTDDDEDDEEEGDADFWLDRNHDRMMIDERLRGGEDWSDSEGIELEELEEEPELPHYHPFYPQLQLGQLYAQYGLPVLGGRNWRGDGIARIDELGDDEEEDSDYGGSFIDDGQVEEQSGDEVEFVDDPALRPRLRRHIIEDEEEEEEEEDQDQDQDFRTMARRLGGGTRLQRRVALRPPSGHESESEDSGSGAGVVDLDDDEEEEFSIPQQRERRRVSARRVYIDADDQDDEDGW